MTPLLFVYGTLRSTAASRLGLEQRARLRREGRVLGGAIVRGRLYDLGSYPGMVAPLDGTDLVHGEVIELCEPALSLAWLDAYEGIRPDSLGCSEYRREERLAQLDADGPIVAARSVTVWVYVYASELSGASRIANGRWGG